MTKMSSSSVLLMVSTFTHVMTSTTVPRNIKRGAIGGIEVRKKADMERVIDLKMVRYSARYTPSVLDLRELSKAIMEPILRTICAMQAVPGLLSHKDPSTLFPIKVMDEEQFVTSLQGCANDWFSV
jgi:hypothetical protein